MNFFVQCLGAFIAIVGFSIVMNVPDKFLPVNGLIGALGWFVYIFSGCFTDSELLCIFWGACVISLGAHICARICKSPVTMFLIPANMTLVPGAGMYHTVYYILYPKEQLASSYFQQTLLSAGMIAAAIFIVDILVGIFLNLKASRKASCDLGILSKKK